jgi:hypothetical protein
MYEYRPKVPKFIECLKDWSFTTKFDKWEVYLWGNFPYNPTGDIDLIFIGKPSEELAELIIEFRDYVKEQTEYVIDHQVFKTTEVFSYIPKMNISDFEFKNIYKYKMSKINSPRVYRKEPKKINKYFWEFDLLGLNEKKLFMLGKTNVHYPILIEDFIKLYNNITNPYTYNTREDPNWEYHTTLRKEFMKIIKKKYRGF